MKVSIDKKYKTRSGITVRVICTDRVSSKGQPVLALINNGIDEYTSFYTAGGFANTDMKFSGLDLVEVMPWDDLKIDDPVMAILDDREFKAHFAGRQEGSTHQIFPTVFPHGCTSWTSTEERILVDDVRKVTDTVKTEPIVPIVPTWSSLNPPFNHYHQTVESYRSDFFDKNQYSFIIEFFEIRKDMRKKHG